MISLCYLDKGREIDNPAGRPQTRVVVAPKGPSDVFSPGGGRIGQDEGMFKQVLYQGFALLRWQFVRGKTKPILGNSSPP